MTPFAECDLRVVGTVVRVVGRRIVIRAVRRGDTTTCRHQLVDQLGAEAVGQLGVGRPPPPAVDLDVVVSCGTSR